MEKTKVAVIGGFLGSGKTTLILNIAKNLIKKGKSVGIVTNDQGSDLIDARFLKDNGLDVVSVKGKCFCCFFDELASKLDQFKKKKAVDVLLLEPVGSAINLVATIFKPFVNNKSVMLQSFNEGFALSPLVVLADPKRVKHLMLSDSNSEYSTPISYLFSKQLEEADLILINKKDTIRDNEQRELVEFLKRKYKNTSVKCISAIQNEYVEEITHLIINGTFVSKAGIDVDYNKFKSIEASLGWLNSNAFVRYDQDVDVNSLMDEYMKTVKKELVISGCHIAHMKCYAIADDDFYKASITSNDDEISINSEMTLKHDAFNIIINARIISSPDVLKHIFENNLKIIFHPQSVNTESFSPKYPKPDHCD
ncbi:MAG TPA: GTP-binding protein [Clostridia bacterium]|jgi:G3E family GTPase|nr:MAG: putative metal chaperone YciC [Firmicutes bacterium ADurb.Bin146]HOD92515.1 GTP-binding protein [Clostridia bacterium]HQM39173.1 GTP-binding protein [Clostridia bacterium]